MRQVPAEEQTGAAVEARGRPFDGDGKHRSGTGEADRARLQRPVSNGGADTTGERRIAPLPFVGSSGDRPPDGYPCQ